MKRTMKILAASLLLALAPVAGAQSGGDIDTQVRVLDRTGANRGQALVAAKIAGNFTSLAGSEENALALVNALRTGDTVQLTYAPTGTSTTPTIGTLDPPTGKMGWGNVKIALALAQDQLTRLGITNPTAEQLQFALNGGDVIVTNADGTTTTTMLRGVLQMRADGMGWGNIAKAGGTKVGPVVSQLKMANTRVSALPPTTADGTAATTVKTRGITTAGGVASPNASRGLTTAEGVVSTNPGKAYGRGIVTAGGGGSTNVAAHGGGKPSGAGAGVMTGGGSSASGVTTAHGNSGGNGKGQGGGNGKGRGG